MVFEFNYLTFTIKPNQIKLKIAIYFGLNCFIRFWSPLVQICFRIYMPPLLHNQQQKPLCNPLLHNNASVRKLETTWFLQKKILIFHQLAQTHNFKEEKRKKEKPTSCPWLKNPPRIRSWSIFVDSVGGGWSISLREGKPLVDLRESRENWVKTEILIDWVSERREGLRGERVIWVESGQQGKKL